LSQHAKDDNEEEEEEENDDGSLLLFFSFSISSPQALLLLLLLQLLLFCCKVLSGFGVRTLSFVLFFFFSNLHDQKVGQSEKQWMDGWM
jgi:uncharacterized membrane protein YphA (DoxX/SURF4 family)